MKSKVVFFLIIILLTSIVFGCYIYKRNRDDHDDTLNGGFATATGSEGNLTLYVKTNKTFRLDEYLVVNFTLENTGDTEIRLINLDVGGYLRVYDINGDVIFYPYAYIDFIISNSSLIILHPGEKVYCEKNVHNGYGGFKRGEKYYLTGIYPNSGMFQNVTMQYWEGVIITNEIMIHTL